MGEAPALGEAVQSSALSGRLETDTFCAACGYNLHGQDVWRDDRLDLLVCRCPECGRHHPAGFGTSASFVWLKRLGTMALVVWMALVLAIIGFATFGLGLFQAGYVGAFTYIQTVTETGQQVDYNYSNGTYGFVDVHTRQPVNYKTVHQRSALRPTSNFAYTGISDEIYGRRQMILIIGAAAIMGLLTGLFLVITLWHWPRRAYMFGCVLPLLAFGFLSLIYFRTDQFEDIRSWANLRGLMIAGIECLGILTGVRIGRPFARTVAQLVVPPKPRMLLTFLWTADGLTMPTKVQRRV